MTDVHRRISDLLHDLPVTAPDVARLGLIGALRHLAEGELAGAFDSVNWQVDSNTEAQIGAIPPLSAEVIFYAAREAMRNAAKYGRGDDSQQALCLKISVSGLDGLTLTFEDNGVGPAARPVALNLNGGSGSGLALHSTIMAVVRGTLSMEAGSQAGTRVTLWLPAT